MAQKKKKLPFKFSGGLLIDEMKIQEGVSFDRHTLRTWGLVELGEHTPEDLKCEVGDHILEVLYQPFEGAWYQSLGCFVSKGNAKGEILSKIVLEGIALCENAGLFVDGVITDGATWNRNMWTIFGIDEENCSSEHPMDADRKLWFLSDWCHLVKCLRNNILPIIPKKKKKVPKKKGCDSNQNEENEDDPDNNFDEDFDSGKKKDDGKSKRYRLETDEEFQKRKDAALTKQIEVHSFNKNPSFLFKYFVPQYF